MSRVICGKKKINMYLNLHDFSCCFCGVFVLRVSQTSIHNFVDLKSNLQIKTTCPEHSNVVFVDSWSLGAGISTNHQSADNRTGQMSRVVPRYSDISQDDNT